MNHRSNGPTTPNSFPSIICSRYRLEMPGLMIPYNWPTISEILQDVGYRTLGMVSANPWISRYFGYNRGFDDFSDYIHGQDEIKSILISKNNRHGKYFNFLFDILSNKSFKIKQDQDIEFASDVLSKLKRVQSEEGSPWFYWVHYMNVHAQYCPKKATFGTLRIRIPLYSRFLNKSIEPSMNANLDGFIRIKQDIINLYDNAVREVDTLIGQLINNIQDFDNTLIIITSDHGDAFYEHGQWQHRYDSLHEECLRIPLIIKFPFKNDIESVTKGTSSVDILPTILHVVKCDNPPIIRGRSLLCDNFSDESIFHEGMDQSHMLRDSNNVQSIYKGITNSNFRLILDESGGHLKMYDLRKDPMEKENIVNSKQHRFVLYNLLEEMEKMSQNEEKTTWIENGVKENLGKLISTLRRNAPQIKKKKS